ncbi:MAG TPA: sodium:proton antiporter, partial [Burkholderiales bacterium]|nr:sodium:proton antiporter [Burkholderiales bacterium]
NRDLILLTASAVVLGTLVIQGLTLKPLLRLLDLRDDDYVGREIAAARERAIHAGLESIADDHSPAAGRIRESFHARPGASPPGVRGERSTDVAPLARALRAARQAVVHARQRGDRRRRVSPP